MEVKPIWLSTNLYAEKASEQKTHIIQAITSQHPIHFLGATGKQPLELSEQLFLGNASGFDSPGCYAFHASLALPLNSAELTLLCSMIQQAPILLKYLSIMQFLGMTMYAALEFFTELGILSEKPKQQFSRLWMIGYLCQAHSSLISTKWALTKGEFTAKMEEVVQETTKKCRSFTSCKDAKFQTHLAHMLSAKTILLKLFLSEGGYNLLQETSCYGIPELHTALQAQQLTPDALYAAMQTMLHFVQDVFHHTTDLQVHSIAIFGQELQKMEQRYLAVYHAHPTHRTSLAEFLEEEGCAENLEEEFEEEDFSSQWHQWLIKTQNEMVSGLIKIVKHMELQHHKKAGPETARERKVQAATFHVLRRQGQKKQPPLTLQQAKLSFALFGEASPKRSTPIEISKVYSRILYELFETLTSLFEHYIVQYEPSYMKIHTRILRTSSMIPPFYSTLVHASNLEESRCFHISKFQLHECPQSCIFSTFDPVEDVWMAYSTQKAAMRFELMENLSPLFSLEEERHAFYELFYRIQEDLQEIKPPQGSFLEYVKKRDAIFSKQEVLSIVERLYTLSSFKPLYPMITQYLEQIYTALSRLTKKHHKLCTNFIDQLSIQTCQKYQKEILDTLEAAFLQNCTSFCIAHILQEDLYFLTQSKEDNPLSFLKSAIGKYLLMEGLEESFEQKLAALNPPQEDPTAQVEAEHTKMPTPCLSKEKALEKKVKAVSQLSPMIQPTTRPQEDIEQQKKEQKKLPPDPAGYKNLKMRKLLSFYNKLKGKFRGQTGSHKQGFQEEIRQHLTVPYHSGGKSISPGLLQQYKRQHEAVKTLQTQPKES